MPTDSEIQQLRERDGAWQWSDDMTFSPGVALDLLHPQLARVPHFPLLSPQTEGGQAACPVSHPKRT